MTVNTRRGLTGSPAFLGLLVALVMLIAFAGAASAQNLSSARIDGVVSDDTGGALPGVTITATSPALQVQALTTVSDAEGIYRFIDLPRGTYQVRFELSGFQPLVRDGLELTAGFAARVNTSLKIGTVSETVTVSGASPIVDMTTTRGGQTLATSQILEQLPGNKTMADVISLSPGLTNTAGENPGSLGLDGRPRFASYGLASGNTNTTMMVDGFQIIANNPLPDVGTTQEVDVRTFGNGAEVREPGVAMNLVVKSGGDQFHGSASEAFMRQPSGNLDAGLIARHLTVGAQQKYFNDSGGDLGGRLIRTKLWFYGAVRKRLSKTSQPGLALNAGPDGVYLTGDEPPAFPKLTGRNLTAKLSYQINQKYQASMYAARDQTTNQADIQIAPFGAAVNFAHTPYDSTDPFNWLPKTTKGELRGTPTSKTFFDVQYGKSGYKLHYGIQPAAVGIPNMYDRTTLLLTGSNIPHISDFNFWIINANLTYIPTSFLGGRHEFKVGYYLGRRDNSGARPHNPAGDYALLFDTVNGVPHVPQEFEANNAPNDPTNWDDTYSVFLSDQWRVGQRLTFNLGLRWDGQDSFVPEQTREAGQFFPAQTFPRIEVLKYSHLAPRAALAWDATGSGHSVLKVTYGWFNPEAGLASGFNQNAPFTNRYRWHDLNGNNNYDPGEVDLSTTGAAPDFISTSSAAGNLLNPNLKLPFVQEITTSFERELAQGMGVRGLYLYRRNGNRTGTVNTLRPYSAYNIPITRQDPGPDGTLSTKDDGGTVTFYDYDAAYRGAAFVANQTQNAPSSVRKDWSQSFEVALNKRLAQRWSLTLSYTANNSHTFVWAQSPNDLFFSNTNTWTWNSKINGSWNLPHDVSIGGIVEILEGPQGTRTYVFRATDPQGGTPLRQLSSLTVRLEPLNSRHEPAYALINLRAGKRFRLSSQHVQLSLDVLNIFNTNSVKAATYVSGPTFGDVTDAVPPRQVRGGILFEF
jgi:hypothetical protein